MSAAERALTFRLPEPLFQAALRAARAEETTPAEVIRAALADWIAREGEAARDGIAALRRALRSDFDGAEDWVALQRRLRAQGLVLRHQDGRLWLMTWPVERRLVPLERLGVSEADLALHYRAPFPDAVGRAPPDPAAAPPMPGPRLAALLRARRGQA